VIGAATRRLALIAVLLVPFAAAAPAAGKEVQSVTACGAGECATSVAAGLLRAMTDVGPPTDPPRGPAPFYRLTVKVGDGGTVFGSYRSWWVPSSGRLLGDDGTWMAVRPVVRRGFDRLTQGLATLPAARLPGFPAAADVVAPPPAAPVSSSGDVPIVPVLAALSALALTGLLVRRHRLGSRPSSGNYAPE
jgi:hypothetical protein